jgi:hypothetical protein
MEPELALCRREDLHDRPIDPGLFGRDMAEEAGSRSGQVGGLNALFLHADGGSVWECTRLRPAPSSSVREDLPVARGGQTALACVHNVPPIRISTAFLLRK